MEGVRIGHLLLLSAREWASERSILLRSLACWLTPKLVGTHDFWCPRMKLFWTIVHDHSLLVPFQEVLFLGTRASNCRNWRTFWLITTWQSRHAVTTRHRTRIWSPSWSGITCLWFSLTLSSSYALVLVSEWLKSFSRVCSKWCSVSV